MKEIIAKVATRSQMYIKNESPLATKPRGVNLLLIKFTIQIINLFNIAEIAIVKIFQEL